MPITVTEKAAGEVKRILQEQKTGGDLPDKVYLRMRVVGGHRRVEPSSAVRETIGRDIDDAHDQRQSGGIAQPGSDVHRAVSYKNTKRA